MKSKKIIFKILFITMLFMLCIIIKQCKSLAADTLYYNKDSEIKIQLDGTDEHYASNSLTPDKITIKVGGNIVTPTTKTLSTQTSITNGVRYILTLKGVQGAGELIVEIKEDTLKDTYENTNNLTTIAPGIIIDNSPPSEVTTGIQINGENSFTIITSASESGSGIKEYRYYIDGSVVSATTSYTYTANNLVLETKEPYIPNGFTHAEGEIISGYVIQDTNNGNEFVWVPVKAKTVSMYVAVVDNAGNITNSDTVSVSLSQLYGKGWDEKEGATSDNKSIAYFKNSVGSYGGFYMARYEAGIPESLTTAISTASVATRDVSGVPVSKKNQIPWNYIMYDNAKANAESMYSTENAKSALINSYSWNMTCNWLVSSGSKTYNEVNIDSSSWANYLKANVTNVTEYSIVKYDVMSNWEKVDNVTKPSGEFWIIKTGNSNYTKANNIFDLAGNVEEIDTKGNTRGSGPNRDRYYQGIYTLRATASDSTPGSFSERGFRSILYK